MENAKSAGDAGGTVMLREGKVLALGGEQAGRAPTERQLVTMIAAAMARDYGYAERDFAFEFELSLGSQIARPDLVVFRSAERHRPQSARIVIECAGGSVKGLERGRGVDKLHSFMAACSDGVYGMWTDGLDYLCYRRVDSEGTIGFAPVAELPSYQQLSAAAGERELSYEAVDAINKAHAPTGKFTVHSSL